MQVNNYISNNYNSFQLKLEHKKPCPLEKENTKQNLTNATTAFFVGIPYFDRYTQNCHKGLFQKKNMGREEGTFFLPNHP